jgi:hypothetical protein
MQLINFEWLKITLIWTAAGGILYRLGGKEGFWGGFRDLGVPAVFLACLWALGGVSWESQALPLTIACLTLSAALRTYKYGLPKPKDYTWPYYALHGFMTALTAAPYAWQTGRWLGFAVRVGICATWMGAWTVAISWVSRRYPWKHWDEVNEWGRGAILIFTVPWLV